MRLVWLGRNGASCPMLRVRLPLIPNAYKYCKPCLSARDTTHRKLLRRAMITRLCARPKRRITSALQSVGSAHTLQVASYPALTPQRRTPPQH